MQDAFFQKNKVWFFTAFSFLLSNTGIGSSRYAGTEEEDRTSSRQIRIHNTSRQKKNKEIWTKKEDDKLSRQILLIKKKDGALLQQICNALCQERNKKIWTEEEDDKLSQQILLIKKKDGALSQQSNTLCKKNNRNKWTREENEQLLRKMSSLPKKPNGKFDWPKISESCPNKSWQQCKKHWEDALNPNIRKGSWTEEENQKLNAAIKRCMDLHPLDFDLKRFPWKEIAKEVPGRTGKQCRNRAFWKCTANLNSQKGPWTQDEDENLKEQLQNPPLNNKGEIQWTEIAESMPGRTPDACKYHAKKNKFNIKQRRK
jgi:hypothetical protein